MAKLNRWRLGICVGLVFCSATQARQLSSQVTELDEIPHLRPEFKVPDDPDMLFYIERSPNSNTVVYAVNRNAQGNLDSGAPVTAFWRWFNVDGQKKALNFVERMMAYGVQFNKAAAGEPVTFKIAALPERTLSLDLEDKQHPRALIQMGSHTARLVYVYLNVVEGGLMPSVPSLDIFAIDNTSGKALREHIVQN
jgi:hypothetical protein